MQFNIIFKTIFEYIHKKFRFVHTNTFCEYRKKLRASPRVHLVNSMHVKSDFITFDHLPLSFSISIDNLHEPIPPRDNPSRDTLSYNCYGASDVNLYNYNLCTY